MLTFAIGRQHKAANQPVPPEVSLVVFPLPEMELEMSLYLGTGLNKVKQSAWREFDM